MEIVNNRSNIRISFEDGRESITLQSDDYFNSEIKWTADEEREYLKERFPFLDDEEINEIINNLQCAEWID